VKRKASGEKNQPPPPTRHAPYLRSTDRKIRFQCHKIDKHLLFKTVRTLHEISACKAMALTVSNVTAKVKQTSYRPGQTLSVPPCWGSQISRQLAHECGTVVRTMHRLPLPPGNIPGTHFCWEAESTPGPWCSQKDHVNEKFRWHSQELNPWPSSLQRSSTAYPTVSRNI